MSNMYLPNKTAHLLWQYMFCKEFKRKVKGQEFLHNKSYKSFEELPSQQLALPPQKKYDSTCSTSNKNASLKLKCKLAKLILTAETITGKITKFIALDDQPFFVVRDRGFCQLMVHLKLMYILPRHIHRLIEQCRRHKFYHKHTD